MAWSNFNVFRKTKDGKGNLVPTFVDRIMHSKMEIMGRKMGIGQIESFYPSKDGKLLNLNVRGT